MKLPYIILCFSLFLSACSHQPSTFQSDHELISIHLPLAQEERPINVSEIADSITYLPLETSQQALIGSVDKLIVTEDQRFIVVDKEIARSIFLFDSTGKFLHAIGHTGTGPGEYTQLEDVSYYKGKLFVWDSSLKKILIFSTNDEYLGACPFEYTAYSLCNLTSTILAFCCDYTPNRELTEKGSCPSLLFVDIEKGGKPRTALPFPTSTAAAAYQATLNNLCHQNLYLPLNDTIYKISKDGYEKKYVLDYAAAYKQEKESYVKRSQTEPLTADDAIQSFQNDRFPHLITYFECEGVDVFFMRMQSYLYYGFYYPLSGTYKEGSTAKGLPVINDIDGIAPFLPRSSEGNVIYSVMPTSVLLEHDSENSHRTQGIHEDDNPVIVKFHMKTIVP